MILAQLCRTNPPAAVSLADIGPVDSGLGVAHSAAVSKKPHKVEEATTPYTAKKPVPAATRPQAGPKSITLEEVRTTNARLMQVHRKVLQKLAQ